jgi:hypothetical protein
MGWRCRGRSPFTRLTVNGYGVGMATQTSNQPVTGLDEIQRRAADFARIDSAADLRAAPRSARDVPRLLAAVEAVLEFHQPVKLSFGSVCGECDDGDGERADWPCETWWGVSRALSGGAA